MDSSVKQQIITAIETLMSPAQLAILLGISEIELKNNILSDAELLKKVRTSIFKLQTDMGVRALEMIDKKYPIDFLTITCANHCEHWSRFVATNELMSSDAILISSAIKGGIANKKDFWRASTQDIRAGFMNAMRSNENFTRFFFDYIEGVPFQKGVHHQAMFDELELIERGVTNILIINIPPRLGKSTTLYAWATKQLMTKAGSNIIYGSYGEVVLTLIRKRIDSAFEKSSQFKNITNPFYEIYGTCKESGFEKESDFLTNINSQFFSATILGGITGRGYSVYSDKPNGAMLIDDPNNPNDVGTARMETIQEKFDTTWYPSRAGINPLIISMQRVASNDITGHILDRFHDTDLNVRVLTLPYEMTNEVDEYIVKMQGKYPKITFIDPKKYMDIGDTLIDAKKVELVKASAHPAIYKTQFLQIPTSLEGSIFKSKMFNNKVVGIELITASKNLPIGYIKCKTQKRYLDNENYITKNVEFEGVFILHIDTTAGNTDATTAKVDDCVFSVCIGGLKGRGKNHAYGAILLQHGINSRDINELGMQETATCLINEIKKIYNINSTKDINPNIVVAIETHTLGGGLASYLRGLNLPNVYVISYSRSWAGAKKTRFIQGSGFYEDRIFWLQDDNIIQPRDKNGEAIIVNDWYYKSRVQHLSVDGDNKNINDDYCEAPVDLANLWISDDKDTIYTEFMKLKKGEMK